MPSPSNQKSSLGISVAEEINFADFTDMPDEYVVEELLDESEDLEGAIAQIHQQDDSVKNSENDHESKLPVTQFRNHFIGYMDLYADIQTVMAYFDAHQGWFMRCARPFKADPLGNTGYAMGVGRVGAFGYQVDPRIGLDLLPQDQGVYRIRTIPIPDQEPQGYEVDFQAAMHLIEKPLLEDQQVDQEIATDTKITSVEWDLNLTVTLQFPKFIHAMPKNLIQKTGDGVLAYVVKKVSNSLTPKVQADFHKAHNISIPKHIKLRKN